MREPKLCRSLTEDKLGKPSKVQNLCFFFGRGFCEEILRPYWVKDVNEANATFVVKTVGF